MHSKHPATRGVKSTRMICVPPLQRLVKQPTSESA